MTNIILTQPQGVVGLSVSAEDIIIPSVSAAPNNVVVVDITEYTAVKWIYTLIDETEDKILMAEVMAVKRKGSPIDANYNHYSIVGDRLKHTIDVKIVGTELGLEITNLHTNQLKCNIVQIQITF